MKDGGGGVGGGASPKTKYAEMGSYIHKTYIQWNPDTNESVVYPMFSGTPKLTDTLGFGGKNVLG